jgi:hypothetical protein
MRDSTPSEDQEIAPLIIWSLLVIGISILAFTAGIAVENANDNFQNQFAQLQLHEK